MTKDHLVEFRQDEAIMMEIAAQTKKEIESKYYLRVESESHKLPTVIYCFMLSTIAHLNRNKRVGETASVNLMDLMTVGIHWAEDEEAEKEGNFVPFIMPGKTFFEILEVGAEHYAPKFNEEGWIELGEDKESIQKICDDVAVLIKQRFSSNLLASTSVLPTVFHAFLQVTMRVLEENKSTEENAKLNLMQLADIGIQYIKDEQKFIPFISPGQEMKLLVKDDDMTEE